MVPFIILLQSCARYTSYYCSGWEITCLYKLQQPPLEDEQRYWLVCHWQRNSFLIIWSICAGWFIFVACSDFHFMFFFIIQTDEKAQLFSANSSINWISCSKLLWSTSQLSSNVLTPAFIDSKVFSDQSWKVCTNLLPNSSQWLWWLSCVFWLFFDGLQLEKVDCWESQNFKFERWKN